MSARGDILNLGKPIGRSIISQDTMVEYLLGRTKFGSVILGRSLRRSVVRELACQHSMPTYREHDRSA